MAYHCIFKGHVQGVGFRARIKHKAKELNITGWVKNCSDGSVEAVFDGSRAKDMIRYGQMMAHVDKVIVEQTDKQYSDFSIRYE